MKLSIVMPTIAGREDELERTIAVYQRYTSVEIEWVIETGHDTCGAAWNAGVPKTTGEILHMGADDIEPESAGWFTAALECLERGFVPLGWVREDRGDGDYVFGRDFARVVICRREWWVDVPPELHYYSDNFFDDAMRAASHLPVPVVGFDFYHRRSMVGRDESPERVARDREAYDAARLHHLQGPGR